jgi:hypothetical protein
MFPMAARRVITGTGRATNPVDGDEITLQLGYVEGSIVTAAVPGLIAGGFTWTIEGGRQVNDFKSGAEAKAHGDTFGGCDTARHAARSVYAIFGHRSLDDALAVELDDLVSAMGGVDARGRWCAATVLQAVRRAIIDVRTRLLAEEIVEARHARIGR